MKPMDDKYSKNIFFILLFFLFVIILYFTYLLANVLVPIFVAIFSALFLQPFIQRLHKTKIPNWLSTIIVVLAFIIIIGFLFIVLLMSLSLFIQDLNKNTENLRDRLGTIINDISKSEMIRDLIRNLSKTDITEDQLKKGMSAVVSNILTIENFIKFATGSLNKTLDIARSFTLYVLALIFVIPGMSRISDKVTSAFPNRNGVKINNVIMNVIDQIQNYMVAKSIISLIIGFFSFIVCLIFGIKYALLWGFMIFLLNFIPYIGSFIATALPITQAISQYLLEYYSPILIIILSILLILAQVAVAYIVEPKFFSRGVNLSPIVIFTSVLVWGYIWGIVGVILSVPIMSAINLVCQNIETLKPISVFISARPKKEKNNANGISKK